MIQRFQVKVIRLGLDSYSVQPTHFVLHSCFTFPPGKQIQCPPFLHFFEWWSNKDFKTNFFSSHWRKNFFFHFVPKKSLKEALKRKNRKKISFETLLLPLLLLQRYRTFEVFEAVRARYRRKCPFKLLYWDKTWK